MSVSVKALKNAYNEAIRQVKPGEWSDPVMIIHLIDPDDEVGLSPHGKVHDGNCPYWPGDPDWLPTGMLSTQIKDLADPQPLCWTCYPLYPVGTLVRSDGFIMAPERVPPVPDSILP